MPMDRSKYPSNWDEIARAVKYEAGLKCQHCGLRHGQWIRRLRSKPEQWRTLSVSEMSAIDAGLPLNTTVWLKPVCIVLTVHHMGVEKPDGSPGDPHDKMDCRPENLIALCQRCHLLADMDTHIANRRRNRIERQRQAGQYDLPLE